MSGQRKLKQNGPPFHFLLFQGNLQNRTRLKGPPFDFFRHCATFSENFLKFQKSPDLEFFDILQNKMLRKLKGSPFLYFLTLFDISENKMTKLLFFFKKKSFALFEP